MSTNTEQDKPLPELPGALIGDDMGLGKTIQAIGVINCIPEIQKVLIICPAAVKLNWVRELRLWLCREFDIAVASGKNWPHMADIVIANYDILNRNLDVIMSKKWDCIIADEVHMIRNAKTARAKAFMQLEAKYRIGLTGTPILNKTMDIFPVLKWLHPKMFGSWYGFRQKFSNKFDGSTEEQRRKLQYALRSSIMVRRLKQEVLKELPAKTRQVIDLDPPESVLDDERNAMQAAAAAESRLEILEAAVELAKASDNPEDYQNAMSALRDACKIAFDEVSRVRHNSSLAKVPFTVDHIKECLESVPKIVVWAHHRDVIDLIVSAIPGAVKITGDMDIAQREKAKQLFIESDACPVLVGSIRAAGTGIDGLQKVCSHVIFHELDWVPAIMVQAEDRTHRIGQSNALLVQFLVFSGTIDANMARKNVEKMRLAEQSLDEDRDKLLNEPVTIAASGNGKARISVTRKDVETRQLSPSEKVAIHNGLQILSGMCDGARELDGHGFSKFDAHLGKSLASLPSLNDRQAILGQKMVNRYRRQLPEELVRLAGVKIKVGKDEE